MSESRAFGERKPVTADQGREPQFGVLLRRHRLARGLSQEELSELSGLSVRAIINIESGKTARPYRDSVRALVDALALTGPQREQLIVLARRFADSDPALWPARPEAEASTPPVAAAFPGRPAGPASFVIPRELPAAVGDFTGREAELAALNRLLGADGQSQAGTVLISAIGGTAGVGKTALAIRWAHQVTGQFPDGQMYVNLRGYDPGPPVMPGDALADFLRALGVAGSDIPDGTEQRARMYRSRLAGRRVLVVLDNACDAGQVRPLLPGDPGCVAVVTSRDALAGLVATDGARRLDLDVLPPADAAGLLRSLIGRRADLDPEAVAEMASLCARLPLALRIAAELAAARPTATLAELVAELAASRLDLLDAGDDRADVRAVFSWSFRQLPDEAAGAFALIGLHPGADLDVHAAAALTGTTPGRARRMLGRLHRASLVQATGSGRYGLHDLLRAYAREQAAARDTGVQCDHALTRLFDYYRGAAAAAMDILFPAQAHRRPRIAPADTILPPMPGQAAARAWLDRERANLVTAVVHCSGHDRPRHATDLAGTLLQYLITGNHLPEAGTICIRQLQAARQSGDLAAEASALNGLGRIATERGQFRDAAGHFQAALERYRRCGDRRGEAGALHNLGVTEQHLHHQESAADYYRRALTAFEDAGDRHGLASTMCGLSLVEDELGAHDLASELLHRALEEFRDQKDQVREAEALMKLGTLNLRRGQPTEAADYFGQSLTIYRRLDSSTGVATALQNLGDVSLSRGECQQAIIYLRQAIALVRRTGYRYGEITALRSLADALHAAGQSAAARDELAAALQLAGETGNTYQQASTHRDLGESHHADGEDERARHHWQQALTLYTELGAPEADHIRSRLNCQPAELVEPRPGPAAGT